MRVFDDMTARDTLTSEAGGLYSANCGGLLALA
jgi:hypothetical protein